MLRTLQILFVYIYNLKFNLRLITNYKNKPKIYKFQITDRIEVNLEKCEVKLSDFKKLKNLFNVNFMVYLIQKLGFKNYKMSIHIINSGLLKRIISAI